MATDWFGLGDDPEPTTLPQGEIDWFGLSDPETPTTPAPAPIEGDWFGIEAEERAQQESEQQFETFQNDVQRLLLTEGLDTTQEERVDQVEDFEFVSSATWRLINADDPEAQRLGFQLYANYGQFMNPFLKAQGVEPTQIMDKAVDAGVNLDEFEVDFTPGGSWWSPIKDATFRIAGQALEILDRPSQMVLSTIADPGGTPRRVASILDPREELQALREGDASAMLGLMPHTMGAFADTSGVNVARGVGDEQGRIENFREALGIDPTAGGRWAGALDTGARIVTDPLTYITFGGAGASSYVKQGTAAAVRRFGREGSEEVVERVIRESGPKGLARLVYEADDAIRATGREFSSLDDAYKYVMDSIADESGQMWAGRAAQALNRIEDGQLRGKLTKSLARWYRRPVDENVARSVRALETGGRAGVRVFGRYTVLPYGRLAGRLRLRNLMNYTTEVNPLGNMPRQAFEEGLGVLQRPGAVAEMFEWAAEQGSDLDTVASNVFGQAAETLPVNQHPIANALAFAHGLVADERAMTQARRVLQDEAFNEDSVRAFVKEIEDNLVDLGPEGTDLLAYAKTIQFSIGKNLSPDDLGAVADGLAERMRHSDFVTGPPTEPSVRRLLADEDALIIPDELGDPAAAAKLTEIPLEEADVSLLDYVDEPVEEIQAQAARIMNSTSGYDDELAEMIDELSAVDFEDLGSAVADVDDKIAELIERHGVTSQHIAQAVWVAPGADDTILRRLEAEITGVAGRTPQSYGEWGTHELYRALTQATDVEDIRYLSRLLSGQYDLARAKNLGGTPPLRVAEAPDLPTPLPTSTVVRRAQDVAEELTPVAPEPFSIVPEGEIRRGLTGVLGDTAFLRGVKQVFRPRAKVMGEKGTGVASKFYDVNAAARTELDLLDSQARTRLLNAWNRALRKWNGSEDELKKLFSQATASAEGMESVSRRFAQEGFERGTQALDTITQIRKEIYDALVESGADPSLLHQLESYIPRVMRPGTIKALSESKTLKPAAKAKIGLTPRQSVAQGDNFLKARNIFKETDDIFELNEKARKWLLDAGMTEKELDNIGSIFVDNVFEAFAVRSRSAFTAASQADLFKALMQIRGADGAALGYIARTADEVTELMGEHAGDYIVDTIPHTELRVAVHKTIEPDLDQIKKILYNDEVLGKIAHGLDTWSNLWGIYATVPLTGGLAFHARNATGNVILAHLSGLKNFDRFADAFRLQRAGHRVRKQMRKTGENWDQAASRVLDERQRTLLKFAQEDGVMDLGFFEDLNYSGTVFEDFEGGGGLTSRLQHNVVTRTGKMVGAAVEDNARLAVYLDEMMKTGDRVIARGRVRKYLFDYRDLTNTEETFRRASRFYTFTRKNTAIQIAALAQTPGRVLNSERIAEAVTDFIYPDGGEGDGPRMLQNWALREGMRYRPGSGGMVGVETPLDAANNTITQLLSFPQMIPQIRERYPEFMRAEDGAAAARESMQLLAGGPWSAMQLWAEVATETDLFTGGPSSVGFDFWMDLSAVIAPLGTKSEQGITNIASVISKEDGWNMILGNLLMGLQVRNVDDVETQMRLLNTLRAQVDDVVRQAKDDGVDLPTLEEMRAEGLMADVDFALRSRLREDPDVALRQVLPSFLEEFGLVPQEAAQVAQVDRGAKIAEQIRLVEAAGYEVTPEMRRWLATQSPYALTNSQFEWIGVEPPRENVFLKENPVPEDVDLAYLQSQLTHIEQGAGLTPGTLLAENPVVPEAIRIWEDALEAGLTRDELAVYVIENLMSRDLVGHLLGKERASEFLEMTRTRLATPEDIRKVRDTATDLTAEISVVTWALGFPITEQRMYELVVGTILTLDQEERLFGERLLPSQNMDRVDVSTDEEKLAEALALLGGAEEGLNSSFFPPSP